jgi:transcriptional regulator with XRE-family HTH domain
MKEFEFKVMTLADKFIEIRSHLNVSQAVVARGYCSRQYISKIETDNNKNNKHITLNYITASEFAEIFNRIANNKKVDIHITPEFLLEPEDAQVSRIIKRFSVEIENIKDTTDFQIYLGKIEEFLATYEEYINDLDILPIYQYVYDKYYNEKEYAQAKVYILKCCTISNKFNLETTKLTLSLTKCLGILSDYKSLIEWAKPFSYTKQDNFEVRTINYNLAKAYKLDNKEDLSIIHLENIREKFTWEYEEIIRNLSLYAECFKSKNEYDKAEIIYQEILEMNAKQNTLYLNDLMYSNLSIIKLDKTEYNKAIEFTKKSLETKSIIYGYEEEIKQGLHYDALKVYLKTNQENEEILNLYLTICDTTNKYFNEKTFMIATEECIYYFMKLSSDKYLNLILKEIKKCVINKYVQDIKLVSVLMYLLQYYKEKNQNIFNEKFSEIYIINEMLNNKKYK